MINFCKTHNLNLVGIFTHLSDSDGNTIDTRILLEQIEKFKNIVKRLRFKIYTHF